MSELAAEYTENPLRDLVRGYELAGLLVGNGSRDRLYYTTRMGKEMLKQYRKRIENPPKPPQGF